MNLFLCSVLLSSVLSQYVPEPYGWACYRMATKRHWKECACVKKSQQRECLCGLPEFVELTERCLNFAVSNSSNPENAAKIARDLSLCPVNVPEEASCLNLTGTSKSLAGIAVESLPEFEYIDPISEDEINMAIETAEWRMTNDCRAERAGASLVAFWAAVIVFRYIWHVLGSLASQRYFTRIMLWSPIKQTRAYFLNAPLGRRHHSEPYLQKLGIRLPTRSISLAILLFAALNYALIFTNFPYCSKNFIYTSKSQQWNKSLAIRCAFVIMWKLPLVFCFAGRNNLLLLLGHPWSLDTFNTFHKWIARITIVDIIIHSIAISLVKAEQNIYRLVWKVDYWIWGVAGTTIATLIAFQSMHWISRSRYEFFKALHIFLAIFFVVTVWYHVNVLPYGTKHVYAIIAIWAFDHACRIVRILMAGVVDAELQHVNEEVVMLTMNTPKAYKLVPRVSSTFLFLHLPPLYLFWQSHPFTLMRQQISHGNENAESSCENGLSISKSANGCRDLSASISASGSSTAAESNEAIEAPKPDLSISKKMLPIIAESLGFSAEKLPTQQKLESKQSTDRLVIAIKRQKGITKRLTKFEDGPIKVIIDGPYGNFYPLHRFRQVICLVGGIGITSPLRYIQYLAERNCAHNMTIKIFWAVRSLDHITWVLNLVQEFMKFVEINIFLDNQSGVDDDNNNNNDQSKANSQENTSINLTRLSCKNIVESEINLLNSQQVPHLNTTAILACGPDKLNDDARLAACWAILNAKAYIDYFEESFSW